MYATTLVYFQQTLGNTTVLVEDRIGGGGSEDWLKYISESLPLLYGLMNKLSKEGNKQYIIINQQNAPTSVMNMSYYLCYNMVLAYDHSGMK